MIKESSPVKIDDKTRELLKKSKYTFNQYMRNSQLKFSKSLDDIWIEKDFDGNGYLDREEAKEFVIEVQKVI